MAIFIRRVGEVADNSVTPAKLADGAVDLSTAKVTGELPTAKLADGAATEAKIADLAISTLKLKDQSVTIAKSVQAMKIHHFVGDETEVSVTGLTEGDVKFFAMPRAASPNSGLQPAKMHINAEVKVTGGTAPTGTLKVYFDGEGTARITINTTSGTFEMQEGNADISDLTNGKHTVRVTLNTDEAGATMTNDLIEIFLEK